TDSDVYAVDVASGKTKNLTAHHGKVFNDASSLSADGKTLLLTSNQKGGFFNVLLLDVASGKRTWVTDIRWEAMSGDFSPDGRSFTYTLNADGDVDAYVVDAASLHASKIPMEPGLSTFSANPNSYSPSGDRLLVSHESSMSPKDFWIYNLHAANSRRLTYSA